METILNDLFKKMGENYSKNKTEKISSHPYTLAIFESLVNDFETRARNFPDREIFVENEKNDLLQKKIDSVTKEDGFYHGFLTFEKGENFTIIGMEWRLLQRFNDLKIDSAPVLTYLWNFHKGYATANFYYSILTIKLPQTQPEPEQGSKELRTTQKTQILILNEMGFFENELFRNATLEKKGEFVARLLNMNIENAKDYLGNMFDKKGGNKKSPYNKQSIQTAKKILSLIGFDLNL